MDRIDTVSVTNLQLGYQPSKPLLPQFSVEAIKGELVALIGRNGVGKSTFLRTIIGTQNPLSGNVNLMGKPVNSLPRLDRAKLLSFVPAEPVRVSNLFIRDFVAISRFPYRSWNDSLSLHDRDLINQSLSLVGIEHLANRDISTVSDGERQRAMIAFALAQDTEIILLDEPTAFLDLPNKYETVRLLSNLAHTKGKTVIYSTHDLQGAMNEADIIWMMLESGFVHASPEDIAINNIFNEMLSQSNVQFDSQTGIFKSIKEQHTPITLEGQGVIYQWTHRMLSRLGFKVERDCNLKVLCVNNGEGNIWLLKDGENLLLTADSITRLARELQKKIDA